MEIAVIKGQDFLAVSYRSYPCRTNIKKFSILFQGPKLWNSLPTGIKAATSFHSFKRFMKSFLRDKQNTVTHAAFYSVALYHWWRSSSLENSGYSVYFESFIGLQSCYYWPSVHHSFCNILQFSSAIWYRATSRYFELFFFLVVENCC